MIRALSLVVVTVAVVGCGSSANPKPIAIGPARTFQLANFSPSGDLRAGRPERISFTVEQPSGAPLTRYRSGPGPHTGVHLIIVRSDLGAIVHLHPSIQPDGRASETLTLPTPGRYRAVVDVYPALAGPLRNFQLFRWLTAAGSARPHKLPPFSPSVTLDGYRFTLRTRPRLQAIRPALLIFDVTDPNGKPTRFTPWFGALAHAIFFRAGSLDYFHTHVCAPGATGCTSVLGRARISGTSGHAGVLHVGVLLPVSGTWRLFLQCKSNGHVLTAPFTLRVR